MLEFVSLYWIIGCTSYRLTQRKGGADWFPVSDVLEVDVEARPPRQGRGEADQGSKDEQTLQSGSDY